MSSQLGDLHVLIYQIMTRTTCFASGQCCTSESLNLIQGKISLIPSAWQLNSSRIKNWILNMPRLHNYAHHKIRLKSFVLVTKQTNNKQNGYLFHLNRNLLNWFMLLADACAVHIGNNVRLNVWKGTKLACLLLPVAKIDLGVYLYRNIFCLHDESTYKPFRFRTYTDRRDCA